MIRKLEECRLAHGLLYAHGTCDLPGNWMKVSNRQYVLCFLFSFLFVAVLPLFFGIHEAWAQRPELVPKKAEVRPADKKTETPQVGKRGEEDDSFTLISEKNIFSPERKEFQPPTFPVPGVDPSKEIKKPVVRPQVTLYGITIAEDYRSATLTVAGRALRKGERDSMTLLPGEQIGEYKVAKILSDRLTLEAQGDSFDVLLYDSGSPKKRQDVRTENKPATVTSTLPTPGSPEKVAGPPTPSTPGPATPSAGSRPEKIGEVQAPRVATPPPGPPNVPSGAPPPSAWEQERRRRLLERIQQEKQ